jgi:two-component system, LuxR family, sensor kinase FixL
MMRISETFVMSDLAPAYYRDVFEYASDAIFIHDYGSGAMIEVNTQACRLTGYSREELIGGFVQHFSMDDPRYCGREALRRIHAVVEHGPQSFEWILRHRQGHHFPVEVELKTLQIAGGVHVLALFRDITKRKLAEARLIERERHFRTLIENSSEGIAILGEDGIVRYVSPSISNVLGYGERRALGRNVFGYIHYDDLAALHATLGRIKPGEGASADVTYRIMHADGSWRHHEATIKDLRHDSAASGFLVNFRDVTERIRAEAVAQQRQRLIEHLARVNTMGELASALAHELSQPFAAMVNYVGGCLERIRSGPMAEDDLVRVLERINAEARRAGQVIQSLRKFSQSAEFSRNVEDLNSIIGEIQPLVQMRANEARAVIVYDLGEDLPDVLCDRVLVEQVLLNIVFNAIEALAQTEPDRRRVVIHTYAIGGFVQVAVEDSGPGLPVANPDKLFEAFFSTKKGGLGVGLALCRSIVDSHGGHVWCTAAHPTGTTFHFTLPMAARAGKADEAQAARGLLHDQR